MGSKIVIEDRESDETVLERKGKVNERQDQV